MRKFKESLKEYAEKNAPNLLRDYSEENPLSPDKIGASSTQEVIWICPFEHREVESVFKRKRRGYCSVCGPMENGSFAQVYPHLLKFWSKDNTVDPYHIPPTYTGQIRWKCNRGHIHETTIQRKSVNPGCPVCNQKGLALFMLKPELRDEWDSDKNSGINPDSVSAYSHTKYHWKCKNGHSYMAAPSNMMRRNSRCPVCASFGYQCPEAAKEWHPTANDHKTPFDFTVNSQYNAVFLCSECGNKYTSRIAYRAKRQSKYCPNCKKKSDL